jgi:hypothetical protein
MLIYCAGRDVGEAIPRLGAFRRSSSRAVGSFFKPLCCFLGFPVRRGTVRRRELRRCALLHAGHPRGEFRRGVRGELFDPGGCLPPPRLAKRAECPPLGCATERRADDNRGGHCHRVFGRGGRGDPAQRGARKALQPSHDDLRLLRRRRLGRIHPTTPGQLGSRVRYLAGKSKGAWRKAAAAAAAAAAATAS